MRGMVSELPGKARVFGGVIDDPPVAIDVIHHGAMAFRPPRRVREVIILPVAQDRWVDSRRSGWLWDVRRQEWAARRAEKRKRRGHGFAGLHGMQSFVGAELPKARCAFGGGDERPPLLPRPAGRFKSLTRGPEKDSLASKSAGGERVPGR